MFLITLHMEHGLLIRCVCHRSDQPARPVEIAGGHFSCRIGKVFRCFVHIRVKRHQHIKRVGRKCQPLDRMAVTFFIRTHLDHREEIIAVDPDRTVSPTHGFITIRRIRIIRCALIMRGKHIFYILHRHFPLRHHAPRQIIRARGVLCIRAIPYPGMRI